MNVESAPGCLFYKPLGLALSSVVAATVSIMLLIFTARSTNGRHSQRIMP